MTVYRNIINYSCPHCGYSLVPFKIDCYNGMVDGWFCCGMNCNYCSIPTIKVYKNSVYDPTIPVYTIYERNSKITSTNEQLINFIKEGSGQITEEQILKMSPQEERPSPLKQRRGQQKGNSYVLELNNIIGYQEIKDTLQDVINIREGKRIHVLIAGAAGTSKTVFLKSMEKELVQQGANFQYIDCSTLTARGLVDYLFEHDDIDILAFDEIDKLDKEYQTAFLNMLETGLLQITVYKNMRKKNIKSMTCIATGNYLSKIIEPLRTRFMAFYLKAYTKEEYLLICEKMLQVKYKYINEDLAKHIASESYKKIRPINMRDADRIARLVRKNPTIEAVNIKISNLTKYSIPKEVLNELDMQI